jgi:NADH:ubiquinone oxidoreductase subunit 5 (subunit L)/multisubunit Na+/H+ antiporter MnhA subunit
LLKYLPITFILGIGLAVALYWNAFAIPNALLRVPPIRWLNIWLYRAMYFDELYQAIIVSITKALAEIAARVDRYLIDPLIDGIAAATRRAARLIAAPTT